MRFIPILVFLLSVFAASATAQSASEHKRAVKKLEREAKRDVGGLVKALELAQRHALASEVRRLATKILKLDPDNAAANEAVGRVRFEGKWLSERQAEKKMAAALAAANKAKGLVEVDGAWVKQDHVEDAKLGIYHYEGALVNRHELGQLQLGAKRHPVTGQLIRAEDLAQAEKGLFPVPGGKWVDQKAADEVHSNLTTPWVYRTFYCWVVSTLPLDDIKTKVAPQVDSAYRKLQLLFGGIEAQQQRRPIVVVLATADQYKKYGDDFGGAESAYGSFFARNLSMKIDGAEARPGVSHWDKNWGPYWCRHAAGLSIAYSFVGPSLAELPAWFPRALGGYVERFTEAGHVKFFGAQHQKKGGVRNLAAWFKDFSINGDQDPGTNDYHIYQAGLCLHFAMYGGNTPATNALQALTKVLAARKDPAAAVKKLQSTLASEQDALKAHFAKVIK